MNAVQVSEVSERTNEWVSLERDAALVPWRRLARWTDRHFLLAKALTGRERETRDWLWVKDGLLYLGSAGGALDWVLLLGGGREEGGGPFARGCAIMPWLTAD